MDAPASEFRPPIMAFATFWNFIADLGARHLPPQIDRSIMSNKSGTDQNNLIAALTGFGLVDAENRVQPSLQRLASTDESERKTALAELVRTHYASALQVSENHGTHQQLQDVFKNELGFDGSPDTRRKAITFLLHALRTAELPVSENFQKIRSGTGGGTRGKRTTNRRQAKPATPAADTPPPGAAAAAQPFSTEVRLKAGTVRLTVDVNPIELRGDDRAFFFALVDMFEDHEAKHPVPADPDPAADVDEGGAS